MLASYSCVQDATEDLAPVISDPNGGSGDVKTLQVTMPVSSRTALGEKVDGKYPVSWSEGDKLAVNGKPTVSIAINESDASSAVFGMPLGITIPYHVVYPYQGEDVAVDAKSGAYPVVFASEQDHTVGTFAQGSAPMYGWSNGFDDVHMEHLATALRFSIKAKDGETVKLKYISVSTVEAEPISGTFDVYCADNGEFEAGTLTAREDAISTVLYNFKDENGEYVEHELTTEETFFITVPKGEYSRFEVSFVSSTGDVCVETFDASGDKQLLGGKVREFPTVTFEANSKMYLIGTDAQMAEFADMVIHNTFNFDGALLVSDIDMTGKEWTSLEGYASLFEGRNHTIKGLTTPLFGKDVVATISNVRVEGNIVEENLGQVGLIARSIVANGDKVGKIFNCSASGSIEYNNEALAVNNYFDLINVGGVVGGVYGGSVSLSESNVNVTVVKVAGEEAKDKAFIPCIGGVVGYACAVGENLPVVVKNTSTGVVIWDDQSKSSKVTPYIGGVAGYVTAGSFSENVNSGELFINEPMYDLDWGGVVGASAVAIENCENKGSLTINEQITKANIGGVLGKLEKGSVVNCENSGKLLFDEKFYIDGSCNIGGVVAYAEKGTESIQNCINSGSMTYLGSCRYESKSSVNTNANFVLGGVLGTVWSKSVKDCRNLETAVINVGGKIAGNGKRTSDTTLEKMTAIGGVIGVRAGHQDDLGYAEAITTNNCSNQGNVSFTWQYCGAAYVFSSACVGIFDSDAIIACKNEGKVNIQATVTTDFAEPETTTMALIYVSGMFGCIKSSCDHIEECSNAGMIEITNSNVRMMYVSGLVGTTISGMAIKLTNCSNAGNIYIADDVYVRNLYVGGILASTSGIAIQYDGCYNSGTVETHATAYGETFMGSIFGWAKDSDKGNGTEGVHNSGQVVYEGTSAIAYVGGYCGRYEESNHTVEFANMSTGVVKYNGTSRLCAFVGGIAGLAGVTDIEIDADGTVTGIKGSTVRIKGYVGINGGEFEKGMSNNGNVTISGISHEIYVGGCFGYAYASELGIGNLSNSGVVTVPDNSSSTDLPENIYMGGVFGYANMSVNYPSATGTISKTSAVHECSNTGSVKYSGIARDGAYVGGVVGRAEKAPIFDCENSGTVYSDGHAGDTCPRYTEAGEKVALYRWAKIHRKDIAVGGVVGETDLDISGCVNDGDVTHECLLNPLRIDIYGELATSRFDVGGIAGRFFVPESNVAYYHVGLEGLVNNGKVTILGTPSSTLCSPSADLESNGEYQWTDVDDNDRQDSRLFVRVNVAGLVGRMMDISKKSGGSGQDKENEFFMNGCQNNGAVTVPEAGGAKCLNVAGAVADLLVCNMTFNGVANTGRIAIDNIGVGTIIAGKQMMHAYFIAMGGIVAKYFNFQVRGNLEGDFTGATKGAHNITFNQCTNEGDIHYGETGASVYQWAGGIMGHVLHHGGDSCFNVSGMGGYSGGKWYKSFANVVFNGCKNSGNIDYKSTIMSSLSSHYNYNYAGGILGAGNIGHNGVTQQFGMVFLKFDHCENSGDIQFDRSNGTASDNADPFYTAVGGIVGFYCGGVGVPTNSPTKVDGGGTVTSAINGCNAEIISCKNSGHIHGFSGVLGGIIGQGFWYVKITGTPEDPTINTGDIVVVRENGQVVTRNKYGRKYMYAGGIAGYLREYESAGYAIGSANEGDNNARPAYMPEHHYCRIEHAVNEGAVGSTGHAGGIAGFYWSAVEPSNRTGKLCDHRGGLEFCRNTGDIYALEETTINVGSIVGKPRMFTYTLNTDIEITEYLSSRDWQLGVRNCEVGGTILRGAIDKFVVDETNYMHLIYGDNWLPTYTSVVDGSPYDGCTVYVPAVDETPEGGEEGSENGAEPTAKR